MNIHAILEPLQDDFINDFDDSDESSSFPLISQVVAARFQEQVDAHYQKIALLFPDRLWRECVLDRRRQPDKFAYLGRSRIRPGRAYYLNLGLAQPWPEASDGADASGMELDLTVVAYSGTYDPGVMLEFLVWESTNAMPLERC